MRRRDQEGDGSILDYVPPPPPPQPAPAPPPPVLTPAQGAAMYRDQYLSPGAELRSANGRYTLVYQGDGNLVLYKNYPFHEPRWLWDSARFSAPGRCVMQGDGNLVIYASGGTYVWDTATNGNAGAYLALQDDGNAVVYRADGHPLWATNTVQPPLPPTGPGPTGPGLEPGQVLHPDSWINSQDGRFSLVFQRDGNLVLYRNVPGADRKALWASNTAGRRTEVCIMQGDGNLVIYGPDGEYVWDSGTGAPGARLVLHPTGNLAIHAPGGETLWQTDTPRVEHFHSFGDDGWLKVTIRPDGTVRFEGHQRNGNIFAESCDFRVGAFVKFDTFRTLALYQTGHLGTKTSPGGSPIDSHWDRTEHSPLVQKYFDDIELHGEFIALQERQGQLSSVLEDILDGMLRWVVGTVLTSTPLGQVILLGTGIASLKDTGSLLPGALFIEGAFWLAGPGGTFYAFLARGITEIGTDGRRDMRDWEYAFGQELFKGTLPPKDRIRVTSLFGLGGRAFVFPTMDGKIGMNMGPRLGAAENASDLVYDDWSLWAHELTHAWQIEHTNLTGAWLADAMYSQTCDFLGADAYEVDDTNLRPFGDYNLEQQAKIVEIWFAETRPPEDPTHPTPEPEDHRYYRYMVENVWMGRP